MRPTEVLCKARYKGRMRPLKLKASVRPSTKQVKHPPCLNEMTAVMQCWKANGFEDSQCKNVMEAFIRCSEAAAANQQPVTVAQTSWWPHEVVNARLRKFVWAQ